MAWRPTDFIIFILTGGLTHVIVDHKEPRKRPAGFRDIIGELKVQNMKLMPGEQDMRFDEEGALRM
jgi:hypothetical protein